MAIFHGAERLQELLEEVPPELRTKLAEGRQLQSAMIREIRDFDRKRGQVANLTTQLSTALQQLQEASENGSGQTESQLAAMTDVVEAASQGLTGDAESVVTEIDGVQSAEESLRAALGDGGNRATSAASGSAAEITGLGEMSGSAIAELQSASEEVGAGAQALAQTIEESRERVTGAVENLRERISEVVSESRERAESALETVDRLAGEHEAWLDQLNGQLSEWKSNTAASARDRLSSELESPVDEKLQEIPGLISDLESVLAEVEEHSRAARDELSTHFSSVQGKVEAAHEIKEKMDELVQGLGI